MVEADYNGVDVYHDEDVGAFYRDQMRDSRASGMKATGTKMNATATSAKPDATAVRQTYGMSRPIASLQAKERVTLVPPKPKVSIMNNRNKADHVRTLI